MTGAACEARGGEPIADGVHRVDTLLRGRWSCLYLFVGSDGALLFDTGVDRTTTTAVLPYLYGIGVDPASVRWIMVSHEDVDHCGGVADARVGLPRARVQAHRDDAAAIENYAVCEDRRVRGFRTPYGLDATMRQRAWSRSVTREGPVDDRLSGGEVIDLGDRQLEVLHLPGHTRGQLGIVDRAAGVVTISDAALGAAVPDAQGRPVAPPTYRYVADYLTSTRRLRLLALPIVATAHFRTFHGRDADAFLADGLAFAARLEGIVTESLPTSGRGTSLSRLVDVVNASGVGSWPVEGAAAALAYPVAGHVEDLAVRGLARIDPDGYIRSTGG